MRCPVKTNREPRPKHQTLATKYQGVNICDSLTAGRSPSLCMSTLVGASFSSLSCVAVSGAKLQRATQQRCAPLGAVVA